MQMDDLRGAGPFMEIVHVLCDDRHVIVLLKLFDKAVSLVGTGRIEFLPQVVVEAVDERRVGFPPLVRGHLLNGIVLPQSVVSAECLESALYRHPCTGQEYDFLHVACIFVLRSVSLRN